MQNNPQPSKLHKTGNRSGKWIGGIIVHSATCKPTMATTDSTAANDAKLFVNKSTSPATLIGRVIVCIHRKIIKQHAYASHSRSITSSGHKLQVATMENQVTNPGEAMANSDRGANGIRMPLSCTECS